MSDLQTWQGRTQRNGTHPSWRDGTLRFQDVHSSKGSK